jgi:hypothetical protein
MTLPPDFDAQTPRDQGDEALGLRPYR